MDRRQLIQALGGGAALLGCGQSPAPETKVISADSASASFSIDGSRDKSNHRSMAGVLRAINSPV